MELKNLLYEKKGHIGIVKFNRPEALNAVDTETAVEISKVFEYMDSDRDIRCVILASNSPRAFSAGGDIEEESKKNTLDAYEFVLVGTKALAAIENFRAPVIAAINGYCLGGGAEFALSCDMRIAADNAKLGFPEITLGVLAGWGGTQRLTRMVGKSKAKEIMLTADKYTAHQALEIGWVDKVVPAESLMDEAMALAEKIAEKPPLAAQYIKILINEGVQCDIHSALRMEGAMAAHLFDTKDNKEACAAFLEKRSPKKWIGR